jgi:hypothetical protein
MGSRTLVGRLGEEQFTSLFYGNFRGKRRDPSKSRALDHRNNLHRFFAAGNRLRRLPRHLATLGSQPNRPRNLVIGMFRRIDRMSYRNPFFGTVSL